MKLYLFGLLILVKSDTTFILIHFYFIFKQPHNTNSKENNLNGSKMNINLIGVDIMFPQNVLLKKLKGWLQLF